MSDIFGKHWHESDGLHVDVSNLPPPEPMVAILALIEQPGMEGPVIVHHHREPLHLYPELLERNWDYEVISSTPGEVCLLITKRQ